MHKKTTPNYGRTVTNSFHADVPFYLAPAITSEVITAGVRYYNCGGRIFLADTYDRIFVPKKTKVLSKSYRGLAVQSKLKRN